MGVKNSLRSKRTSTSVSLLAAKEDKEAAEMKERIHALTNAFGFKDLMDCMDSMVVTLEQAAQQELDRP